MTSPGSPQITHPDWCVPQRCGHVVPPIMREMARKHRSAMQQVGNLRLPGCVISYLIAGDDQEPIVTVHVSSSRTFAKGWAELSLRDTARLVEQLNGLLELAGYAQEGNEK